MHKVSFATYSASGISNQNLAARDDVSRLERRVATGDPQAADRLLELASDHDTDRGKHAMVALLSIDHAALPDDRRPRIGAVCDKAIHALADLVTTGDLGALELLLNLCADPREAPASRATNCILNLYATARLRADIRAAIGEQAGELFNALVKTDEERQRRQLSDPPRRISAEVLYLAGHHALEIQTGDAQAQSVGSALKQRLACKELQKTNPVQLLSKGRFIEDVELMSAAPESDKFDVPRDLLLLRPDGDDSIGELAGRPVPGIAFISIDNKHWVTLATCNGQDGKTDCVVFDSDYYQGHEGNERLLNQRLPGALGAKFGAMSYVGFDLQRSGAPNACGAFAALIARTLVEDYEGNVISAEGIERTFRNRGSEWAALAKDAPADLVALVAVQRASMLTQARDVDWSHVVPGVASGGSRSPAQEQE